MDHASVPSPAQLALAVAIVKQKPVDQDIKGKQHIKEVKDNDQSYPQEKFFDSVSFWQQAYEKSEAEQSTLLDRIYELERRNEALFSKLRTQEGDLEKDQGSSKRKAPAGKNGAATRKRAKTQVFSRTNGPSGSGPASNEDGIGSFEYSEEASLCKAASDGVLRAGSQKGTTAGRSKKVTVRRKEPDVPAVLRSVEHTFKLLSQALEKLSESEHDSGQVIYHTVNLYESTLNALQQRCRVRSEQAPSKTKSNKQKQPAKSKRATKNQSTDTQSNAEDEIATQLTRLLYSMTLTFGPSFPLRQTPLEGFLSILLSRVGKLLSLFVFQDLQLQPDLQLDPAKLPLPGGLREVDVDEKSLCAAKMEAKQLVWLLERFLALLDTVPSLSSSLVSQEGGTGSIFVSNIKERLQSTLLQAVFGKSVGFKNVLQCPVQPEQADLNRFQTSFRTSEQDIPDWFVQEVWRLLGWEILANNL
ncbi:uncharacterized protein ATNIH1004_001493 [Aspergillus tanneri]|uniref:Uncharacterized protein n=1 Tax=Aspergillus tanneri TaxID=1220188 RepID=A0A5M9N0G9_9EURO|nr:uncharacterized protein ATNIH1004_001493 [Aspergillus tanneri]KAA8652588.1 hypothetical protein ATNIH1004_001493 [Aspergillus tanneri]